MSMLRSSEKLLLYNSSGKMEHLCVLLVLFTCGSKGNHFWTRDFWNLYGVVDLLVASPVEAALKGVQP